MNVLVSILSIIFILLKCEFESAALTKKAKPHAASNIFSEYGYLANISTQHVLSSGISGNSQVIEKFVALIRDLASNFDMYKNAKLSVNEFQYPSKCFEIGLSNKSALFHKVSASQIFHGGTDNHWFTTSVECDSSGTSIIRESLPPTINIEAEIIIRSRENDFKVKGKISYMMKNSAFVKQSHISNSEWNSESNIKNRLFYDDSEVELETDIEDHKAIYKKLNSYVSNIESSLVNHLLKQLNVELVKRNATFSTFFKFMKPNQANRLEPTVISPALVGNNSLLNELYIVPNVNFTELSELSKYILQNLEPEFGQVVTLDPYRVIVEGLSNFTNIKTAFSYKQLVSNKHKFINYMIVWIKSGILTGKFTWTYCKKANDTETTRNIEFLFKANRAEIEIKTERICYNYFDDRGSCRTYVIRSPEVGINLKKIQIKTNLPNSYCENISKSVQNVLNEYLELAIGESLKNLIAKKVNRDHEFDKLKM